MNFVTRMPGERLLVAMSGGVDSSVAALLLKQQGHHVVGAYMKNWINEDKVAGHCPWQQDIKDARAVAERIGIEFRVVNLIQDYRRLVVEYLLDGYRRGLTPNPDAMCNREMKFGVFLDYARAEGFDAVATGHYARRLAVDAGAGLGLFEGADTGKDQSYFLALLSQQQLRRSRFPIGHLRKPELRRIAAAEGLPTAAKKDSQGICFIGEVRMSDFLKAYVPEEPGPIVRAADNAVIGEHRGLHYYTIGQRRGIRVPSNTDHQAYVVVEKRGSDRTLVVAFDGPEAPGLWTRSCQVHSLSFLGEPIAGCREMECRVRYRDPRIAIRFEPDGSGAATVTFAAPQRAIAPGQVIALYDGPRLLGGGIFG